MAARKILIAEDDRIVARDLRETVEGLGHRVVAVTHSATDAVAAARRGTADIALLDIRMPGSDDGIDAGRSIRRELDIPVLFLSAYSDTQTLERAKASEPLAYLVKPVDARELDTAIELAAHRHELERRLRSTRRRYRTLFRSSPVPIHVVTVEDGTLVDANRAFFEGLGYDRGTLIGRSVEGLELWVDPPVREQVVDRVLREGEVRAVETQLRTRDGDLRSVEVFAEAVELEGDRCILFVMNDVTEEVALRAELKRRALYDDATGLPNRTLVRDRLEHALERSRRTGTGIGVLFVDLDRFKSVNDTFGHAEGDRILEEAAHRIDGCFRGEDTVGRFGGDEFVVILEAVEERGEAAEAAGRVVSAVSAPFRVEETPVRLGASVGVALCRGGEVSPERLLRSSDSAMYRAKEEGGGRYSIFEVPGSDGLPAGRPSAP